MFIEKAYLFQGMEQDFMDQISKVLVEETYPKGEFLFREGEPANFLYILQDGGVRIRLGQKGYLSRMVTNSGEAFGWSSLLGRDVYSATAECVAATRVMKIKKEKLNEIFENNPANGLTFFKRLAEVISRRLTDSYKLFLADHGKSDSSSYG